MPRRAPLPQSRHHIYIYDEDWEFLLEMYGPQSSNPVGLSAIIRNVVHQRVLGLKAAQEEKIDERRRLQND
jgi:hypothetical protein